MMLFSPVKESATAGLDLNRPITVLDVLSAIHDEYVLLPSKFFSERRLTLTLCMQFRH